MENKKTIKNSNKSIKMIAVEGGTFTMGNELTDG